MKAKNIITKALLLGFVTSITKWLLTAISMFEISEVIYRCLLTLDLLCALGFGALLLVFVRNVENNKQMWTLVAVHAMGLVIGELLARLMFPLLQYIPLKNGYDQLLTSLRMFALPALYLLMVVIGLTCYTVVNRKKRKAKAMEDIGEHSLLKEAVGQNYLSNRGIGVLLSLLVIISAICCCFNPFDGFIDKHSTFLARSESPDGTYVLEAYRLEGGATVDYSIKVYLTRGKMKKLIYNEYHGYDAEIEWLSDSEAMINKKVLNIKEGEKYDWRN